MYFCQPAGFEDTSRPDLVCCLNKSLYSLKQEPRAWYNRFASFLLCLEFVESKADTSLFVLRVDPTQLTCVFTSMTLCCLPP
jgi:hypothetical protein